MLIVSLGTSLFTYVALGGISIFALRTVGEDVDVLRDKVQPAVSYSAEVSNHLSRLGHAGEPRQDGIHD